MKLLEPHPTPHTPPSKSSLDPMRVQWENVPFHLLAQEVPVGLVVPCDPVTRQRVCDRISFRGCDLTHLTHHSTWLRHGLKQQARGGGNFWNDAINHRFISWCQEPSSPIIGYFFFTSMLSWTCSIHTHTCMMVLRRGSLFSYPYMWSIFFIRVS